jgi:FkbM family methyltransferase
MLINFQKLLQENNILPKGIIQCGAHLFQEKNEFISCGIKDFVLIEMQTNIFIDLIKKANNTESLLFNVAISDSNESSEIFVDRQNQGQSASILKPKKHSDIYPMITFDQKSGVKTTTLDSLKFDRSKYNILFMDLQGAELKALKGASKTLPFIDCIYSEVNYIEMYEGCVLFTELCSFLYEKGFKLIQEGPDQGGWSDAFFVKF